MTRYLGATLITLLSLAAAMWTMPARAQGPCPGGEGRLSDGTCVNPGLASAMRQRGVLTTQLKISETALPIGPHQDTHYPRAAQFNSYELQSGNFSVNPLPKSP